MEWTTQVIAKTHPEIGRSGAICPMGNLAIRESESDSLFIILRICFYPSLRRKRNPLYHALLLVLPSNTEETCTNVEISLETI
ncbi:DUF6875 domain-containing protein [Paenibacillus sp. NPDC057967]|uniref:DUF6875 domain-containing protein n=1 Tax=Paenibacillus sp. NPDC057967 TaxID=3346293 RepID=UPI0036DCBCFF